jgi:hypothetical protein
VDGENGWRFTTASHRLFDAASAKHTALFRDLLYHDPECRRFLRLRRANYEDSLEIYAFSERPIETDKAFSDAMEAKG